MSDTEMATPQASKAEVMFAMAYFSLSSIGMMLGNKMATNYLPLPSTLVIAQALFTVIPLALSSEVIPLQRQLIIRWMPCAVLFAMMLFTSMQSFLFANVSTILVFRNIATIVSTVVEYFVRGKVANYRIVASEITIVLGCVIYGWTQLGLKFWGLFWVLLNVGAQVAYGNIVKLYLCNLKDPHGNELGKYSCAYYNNVLGLPFFFVTFALWGEYKAVVPSVMKIQTWGWCIILFTCVMGYFLATTGFGLQKLVSATSFLVINNMVKIGNILLGIIFLNDRFSGLMPALGCVISLGAGVWYSWEQNALNNAPITKHVMSGCTIDPEPENNKSVKS
jgi:drug/metabolite transporter (DMT)-like permease